MSKYDNAILPDKAILVGLGLDETIDETALDELASLCATCNISTAGRTVQNRDKPDPATAVGKGKAEEIAHMVDQAQADCVVFDIELSGSKVRNLEALFGVPVLDRSKVILDIFAQRAGSAEGKLQVELAQLKYNLPRLIGSGGLMSKMKNAVGMRGPGEKKLELDKRTIRDQILALEKQLVKVSQNRDLNRRSAVKGGKARVSLVGYTNSGKSTLMNTMSKAGVLAEDMLFATLDAKTNNVYLQREDGSGVQILLTDTVGFIDKLPHEFISAFESTLDEARYADLLLHVVDVSNPDYPNQMAVVNQVLGKIGADKIPQIIVFNKVDMLDKNQAPAVTGSVAISAKQKTNIDELKEKIIEWLETTKV